jgi:hypothetical protein
VHCRYAITWASTQWFAACKHGQREFEVRVAHLVLGRRTALNALARRSLAHGRGEGRTSPEVSRAPISPRYSCAWSWPGGRRVAMRPEGGRGRLPAAAGASFGSGLIQPPTAASSMAWRISEPRRPSWPCARRSVGGVAAACGGGQVRSGARGECRRTGNGPRRLGRARGECRRTDRQNPSARDPTNARYRSISAPEEHFALGEQPRQAMGSRRGRR